MANLTERSLKGTWVQTEREAHEAWARLIRRSPKAAELMHLITARIGDNNAVVMSIPTIMKLMNTSRPTVIRAVNLLRDDRWLETVQVGGSGTTNAYVVNDRVAWTGPRDGIRFSLFSAAVIATDDEQPNQERLGREEPLRKLPQVGERQLPTGNGLPPPSQPFLHGLEVELPEIPEIELDNFEELVQGKDGKWFIKRILGQRSYNDDGTYELLGAFITSTELTAEEIKKRSTNKALGNS
jgi:hypothetical protein